jgi:DNA-3-methyladenine glycosylase II
MAGRSADIVGADSSVGRARLAAKHPELARWMQRIGPLDLPELKRFQPVHALAQSIVYQQLSGKAAATIFARVLTAIDSPTVTAAALARTDDASLRSAGLSANKLLALRDLQARATARAIPSFAKLQEMDDASIVASLSQVRGIGEWTVQMMLLFSLAREDVWPTADLGVQKGVQKIFGLATLPKAKELPQLGRDFAPDRSLLSLYCWRAAELKNAE